MRKHLTPSLVIACLALFISLSGGAYALTVSGKKIQNGTITDRGRLPAGHAARVPLLAHAEVDRRRAQRLRRGTEGLLVHARVLA